METVTINVQDDVIREFRKVAAETFGSGKGHLGKAFTEALQAWMFERKQKKIAREAIEFLNTDFHSGGWTYPHRSVLHDR
jgi:hypothetical protein